MPPDAQWAVARTLMRLSAVAAEIAPRGTAMIDASAFSVAARYQRAAPPLRRPRRRPGRRLHAPRRAAGLRGPAVRPRVGPADADGLLAGVPLAHRDAFDTGLHAPRLGPRATGEPRPAASVLRRLAGMAR